MAVSHTPNSPSKTLASYPLALETLIIATSKYAHKFNNHDGESRDSIQCQEIIS